MTRFVKNIGIYGVTFIGLILVFNLCLYLASLFTSDLLEENAKASFKILHKQSGDPVIFPITGVRNDNYTDALIINELYSVDSQQPFLSYMKVRKNYHPGLTEVELPDILGRAACGFYNYKTEHESFRDWYHDESEDRGGQVSELGHFLDNHLHVSVVYGRYWHGYIALYRPLLALMDVSGIRNLLLVAFSGLFIWQLLLLYRRFGRDVAFIFGTALLFSGYFTASFSLQGAPIFLITSIGTIVLLKKIDTLRHVGLLLFVVACFINYVDYLTVPMISLGILCAIYLLKMIEDGQNWHQCLRFIVTSTIIWILGYASTWVSKWILYDILVHDGPGMVFTGLQQILFRTAQESFYTHPNDKAQYLITVIILGRATFFAMITGIVLLRLRKFSIPSIRAFNHQALPFMVLSLIPPVWFIALANHTITHTNFTYRMAVVYMLGLLLGLRELFRGKHT